MAVSFIREGIFAGGPVQDQRELHPFDWDSSLTVHIEEPGERLDTPVHLIVPVRRFADVKHDTVISVGGRNDV